MTDQDFKEAASKIIKSWGVSASDKLTAIRILLSGKVNPDKVVNAINEISNGQGYLESLRLDCIDT